MTAVSRTSHLTLISNSSISMFRTDETITDKPPKPSSTNTRRSVRGRCAISRELQGISKHGTQRSTREKIEALRRELTRFRKLPAQSGYIRHRIRVMEHTIKELLKGRLSFLPTICTKFVLGLSRNSLRCCCLLRS